MLLSRNNPIHPALAAQQALMEGKGAWRKNERQALGDMALERRPELLGGGDPNKLPTGKRRPIAPEERHSLGGSIERLVGRSTQRPAQKVTGPTKVRTLAAIEKLKKRR